MSAGGANSGIFQMLAPSALAGTYDGLKFGLDLARKDLRYYTHLTEHLGLPSYLGETVHQSFVLASALGIRRQIRRIDGGGAGENHRHGDRSPLSRIN